MVFTEQQLQVKKLVDIQQDIEIDALNDGVGALSTSMQNGFTQASNNFNDIQNSLAVMNSLSESRYNTLYDSVNILSNDMSNIASGLGDAISNVASDMINMNNGIQNTFYGMENDYLDRFNQVNTNIGDSINNFHNEISNDLYVNVFSADTMIYNVSATPVNSLTALGYDSNGKIIPVTVIANTNIQFPTSADYLYTDVAGTAFGGTADTAVSTNENLVTSHAVYNAVNDIWTDLNEFHNEVTNSFGSVQNSFNDVNNAHNALYQNVVDGFIDVWGNFDKVNNSITNMNSNIQGQFNDVNSTIDNDNLRINYICNLFGSMTPLNYLNSDTPVNYQSVTKIDYKIGTIGNLWSDSSTQLGNKYYDWNSTTNTLTFSSMTGDFVLNNNLAYLFYGCTNLNQNIKLPDNAVNMCCMFLDCTNLNQNIKLPDNIPYVSDPFDVTNSVTLAMFANCTSLNQNIKIPENVRDTEDMFAGCTSLNQNIKIPNNTIYLANMFAGCTSLNQNIKIPENAGLYHVSSYSLRLQPFYAMFLNCTNLNQNIVIPRLYSNNNNLSYGKILSSMFSGCTNLNQTICIPNNVRQIDYMFYNCYNLNCDIYMYSSFLVSNNYETMLSRYGNAFWNCSNIKNLHVKKNLNLSSPYFDFLYNGLLGHDFTGHVVNDLEVPETWPPTV